MGGFSNPDIAKKAGKKSKRGKSTFSVEIKTQLQGIIDIPKLAKMLDELEPRDYVRAKIDLLRILIPKVSDIDMTVSNFTLKDMDKLSHEERLEALKDIGL